jgi:hypothetical protein
MFVLSPLVSSGTSFSRGKKSPEQNYSMGGQYLHGEERPTFPLERLNDLLSGR